MPLNPQHKNVAGSDAQAEQDVTTYLEQMNPLPLHNKSQHRKAIAALIAVCFLWGTTWLASREGVKHMPALQLVGMRQLLGGVCYVVFFLIKGYHLPKGKEWGPILVLCVLNFLLSNALSTWGVKFISAGLGSIIGAIFPLWLVLIAAFSSHSKLRFNTVIGLLLGFAGVCVIFFDHLQDFLNPEFRFGIFISIASTWSWAFGTLYTKKQAANFNPYFSLGLQMVISGTALIGGSFALGYAIPLAAIPNASWMAIAYLVTAGSILTFLAYLYALQHLPTEQVSLYAYVNPVVAVLLGWQLLGEELSGYIIIGMLITLVGVYLVNKSIMKMLPAKRVKEEN
ncbi:DMT family transporter [Flavisolibacter tropicus]|nr:EamA family transporter [Flavisolibacter tropicus]